MECVNGEIFRVSITAGSVRNGGLEWSELRSMYESYAPAEAIGMRCVAW